MTQWLASVALVAFLGLPANVEAQAFQCSNSTGVPPLVRGEGQAELLGEIVLDCWGGTPTALNQAVPQVDIKVNLDTALTSKVTSIINSVYFTEALLLVDEPNSPTHPAMPILNCGNTGAPDNGPGGPGVCSILGGGAAGASATYNGTAGHPNAFQGRLISGETNKVLFASVPIDPPGNICPTPVAGLCHRIFRITNLRGNATRYGATFLQTQVINSFLLVNPLNGLPMDQPDIHVARVNPGLRFTVGGASVYLRETFPVAWKPKNISFTFTNGVQCPSYSYAGGTAYPPDAAQNVPGFANDTESGFQWQNNSPNGPPSPNLPCFSPVQNIGSPLSSAGFGGFNTGIATSGVADSGTRLALRFENIPPGASVEIPQIVQLSNVITHAITGVMVRTNTDSAGAGAFSDGVGALTPGSNLAVYEVLFGNPNALEGADIPYTVLNGPSTGIHVTVRFAPFYSAWDSGQAGTEYPVPRFLDRHYTPSKAGIFRPDLFMAVAQDVNGNIAWDQNIDKVAFFGTTGDTIIYGDWNGDGSTKVGIFRSGVGMFALDMNGNGAWDPGIDVYGFFGQNGDQPIVGDWNANGATKVGIYRPASGLFALDYNGNLTYDAGVDKAHVFGLVGDTPVIGDWTGDGKAKVGVYRSGLWILDSNNNLTLDVTDANGTIGEAGDTPLLGDWSGDGRTKVGYYRSSEGVFAQDYDGNLVWDSSVDPSGVFGAPNSIPIVGDWTGTGVTRVGVFFGIGGNGYWGLDTNGSLSWDAGVLFGGFGAATGDTPAVGKWQ